MTASPTALNVIVVPPFSVVGVRTQDPDPPTTTKILICPTVPLASDAASEPDDKVSSVTALVKSAVDVPVDD